MRPDAPGRMRTAARLLAAGGGRRGPGFGSGSVLSSVRVPGPLGQVGPRPSGAAPIAVPGACWPPSGPFWGRAVAVGGCWALRTGGPVRAVWGRER